MSSAKCSQCGLVNFSSAGVCKRCKASPIAPGEPGVSPDSKEMDSNPMEPPSEVPRKFTIRPYEEPEVRTSFSPLRVLVMVLLVVAGAWCYYKQSESDRLAQLEKDKQFQQMRSLKNREAAMALDGNKGVAHGF